MAIIYTNQSSGAIRRLRRRKPTKAYLEALQKQIKYLKKLGFSTPKDVYCNFTSQVQIFRKQWLDKKLFTEYPTDGIVVKINSRKLQLLREKSYGCYPYWQMAIKY